MAALVNSFPAIPRAVWLRGFAPARRTKFNFPGVPACVAKNLVLCIALGVGAATALASDRDLKPIAIPTAPTSQAGATGKLRAVARH
jgi:hypothetical protein